VADAFRQYAPGRHVLDAGCGSGDLVAFLAANGFDAIGFDPSKDAVRHGEVRGLRIEQATISGYAERYVDRRGDLDAISLMGVLDCVPEAPAALRDLEGCLKPGGVLYIWVGNQFNLLQTAARDALRLDPWWVVVPDHLNYFDRESLLKLLDDVGFDVLDVMSDFPMEMFLLMGDNYRADPAVGAACHARRVAFEMGLPAEQRRKLYRGFAAQGIGRCIHVVARKRG
jgi:SAM-dependent methyltransferase